MGSASVPASPTTDEAALRLARQIDKWLDGHKASGDAFVASVYGEWGIGKTYCLKALREHYAWRIDRALETSPGPVGPLVVPVWFEPWRYEHEEHLVVPMLKTIEHKLLQLEPRVIEACTGAWADGNAHDGSIRRTEELGKALRGSAEKVGRLAQALLSAVKFKAAPFGVGLDIDPKAAIEEVKRVRKKPAANGDAKPKRLAEQESIYFDAQAQLESVTQPLGSAAQPQDAVQLRLVLLVDDLDRCLPEKAIQVLESVKLFLNVPGFSFVLAVDDEVVERGIAHRYRDYRLADKDGASLGSAPISGTQYLEKIVHLPVHLPRWTTEKAREFLVSRYPHLYGSADASGIEEARVEETQLAGARGESQTKRLSGKSAPVPRSVVSAESLQMVLRGVPLVPRKLIRLSEGVEYLQSQFADLAMQARWAQPHAIRVVALQQLHPTLYRHLRQRAARYWRLFELSRDAWGEPRYSDGASLSTLDAEFGRRAHDPGLSDPSNSQTRAAQSQERENQLEKLELLRVVHHSGAQRGAGDPLKLFTVKSEPPTPNELGLGQQSFSDLYFSAEAPHAPAPRPTASNTGTLPEAQIADVEAAVAALMTTDAVSRTEFIERHELRGKRLPPAVLARLLEQLATNHAASRALNLPWLRDIAQVTSAEQLLAIYDKARVIERWVEALPQKVQPWRR